MKASRVWLIARGLLLIHAFWAIAVWSRLPAQIPTHFGFDGQPDAWGEPTLFHWFILLGVATAVHGLLQLITLPGAVELWNFPGKEDFLKLTPERQQPAIQLVKLFGGVISTCVTFTMFALNIGVYLVAHGHSLTLPWFVRVAMFAPVACIFLALIPWSRAVRRAVAQQVAAN